MYDRMKRYATRLMVPSVDPGDGEVLSGPAVEPTRHDKVDDSLPPILASCFQKPESFVSSGWQASLNKWIEACYNQ